MAINLTKASGLLYRAGAHKTKHSGRTLLDHLIGTAALLQAARFPSYVVMGGLYHSIYGTNAFRKKSLTYAKRSSVMQAIGRDAENLAYTFSRINRPRAIRGAVRAVMVNPDIQAVKMRLRGRDEFISLHPQNVAALAAIEVANLIEQGVYQDCAEFAATAELIRNAVSQSNAAPRGLAPPC